MTQDKLAQQLNLALINKTGELPNFLENKTYRELMGDLAPVIDSVFRFMDIAEEEIAKGKIQWPDRAEQIHQSFSALRPTPDLHMNRFAEEMYRSHCKELIHRIVEAHELDEKRIDLTRPTSAEVCIVLSETSSKSGLSGAATSIYMRNFVKVFGFNPANNEDDKPDDWRVAQTDPDNWTHWGYEAETQERKLRDKLVQEWRVLEFDIVT